MVESPVDVRGWSPRANDEVVGAVVLTRGQGGRTDGDAALLRHPLVPVALVPQLAYPLRWLEHAGVTEIAVSVRDANADLSTWLASPVNAGLSVRCMVDPYPRGPAGSVRDAVAQMAATRIVVVEGARLPLFDLPALLATHRASGAAITTVLEHDRRLRSDVAPAHPGGVYVFERDALDLVPAAGFHDIKQGLLLAANRKGLAVQAYHRTGITPAITDRESYLAATRWLVSNAAAGPQAFYDQFRRDHESLVHPTADVSPSSILIGPVVIGPGARLAAGSVIVGPSVVGAGAVMCANATLACGVLLDGAVLEEGAIADHAVLAPYTVLAAGTVAEHQLVSTTEKSRMGRRARERTTPRRLAS
jgi:mannose-1-phosphate guanylyltransferase